MKQFNLKVDEQDWEQFEAWAKIQGSNPTEQLRAFISSIARDKIPDNYQSQIDQRIYKTLADCVDSKLILKLSKLVAKELNISSIYDIDDARKRANIDNIVYIDSGNNIDKVDSIDESVADKPTSDAQKKSDRSLSSDEKASDRPIEARLNHRTYTDAQVAAKEKLSQASICCYRSGKRQPRDKTFWSRWIVCSYNNQFWERISTQSK